MSQRSSISSRQKYSFSGSGMAVLPPDDARFFEDGNPCSVPFLFLTRLGELHQEQNRGNRNERVKMASFLALSLLRSSSLASIGGVGERICCVLVDLPVAGALGWYGAHAAVISIRDEQVAPEGRYGRRSPAAEAGRDSRHRRRPLT
jgi:hypothetical protein